MNNLLLNKDGQLRSGWRAGVFLLTFLFLSFFFIFCAMTALELLPMGPSAGSYLPLVIPFGISAIIAVFLGWLYGKLFEKLPYAALGITIGDKSFRNFLLGLIIGGVAIVSGVIIAVLFGGMSFAINHESTASSITTSLAITFVIFAVGALSEETLFRGYPLQTFVRADLTLFGIGVTSALFAFAHNNNPDVSRLALLNTFLAGIWFALAYLKTRDLWLPFGMHVMWNWLQGPVFGINVSGIAELSPDPVLRATDAGPAWLTGGTYGIEGGIACTIAIVISIAAIYFVPIRSNHIET